MKNGWLEMALDLDFVRSQFPAFGEPSLQGWAFFENAGGSYACRQVIDRLAHFYTSTKVQPYGSYPASQAAGVAMDESYAALAAYLNVKPQELHLGPSTTQNTYVLAQAMRGMWSTGDEVVCSNQDHEANAGFWRRMADSGIVVREWGVDPQSGYLNPDDLDGLLNERTKLLVFPHCSNIVGQPNPVAEIAAKAHAVGAVVVVDGVSYAPHGLPDVGSLDADVYMFSLYKTWGPHLGLMTVRDSLLEKLDNQGHFFNAADKRKKLVPAGPDHAQVAAAAGVAQYLDTIYTHHFGDRATAAERGRRLRKLFQTHERKLLGHLLGWLCERDDLRIIGPDDETLRVPTVALLPRSKSLAEVQATLVRHKVMVGDGHFYAVRVLEAMGIAPNPGVLRLSFVHYTSEGEVAQLIDGLSAALEP